MRKTNQQGFALLELLLVIITLAAIGAAGYFAYQANHKDKSTTQSATTTTPAAKENSSTKEAAKPINAGWKEYKSTAQNISFEYPDGWFVREEADINSIYISSHQGDFNKGNIPSGYQSMWISTWDQEATVENENSVKSGNLRGREAGPITPGTLKAGAVSINTYEYQTVGGPTLQAFWIMGGKHFYATNSTEIGNQDAMVATLKKLLPTVR